MTKTPTSCVTPKSSVASAASDAPPVISVRADTASDSMPSGTAPSNSAPNDIVARVPTSAAPMLKPRPAKSAT
jgi:hypothetical protein